MRRICFLLVPFMLLLTACDSRPQSESAMTPREPSKSEQTAPAENVWTSKVKISTPDDQRLMEIKWNAEKIKVEVGVEGNPTALKGELRDNGKRKYSIEGGAPIAEVKGDSSGFKLRTGEGTLLWKVKFSGDKIKISNNEENRNPYEIHIKGDDVRVEENGVDLGEVKFYPDRNRVKVKRAPDFEIAQSNTPVRSVAFALLLMERISPPEQAVIIAELLARGK